MPEEIVEIETVDHTKIKIEPLVILEKTYTHCIITIGGYTMHQSNDVVTQVLLGTELGEYKVEAVNVPATIIESWVSDHTIVDYCLKALGLEKQL